MSFGHDWVSTKGVSREKLKDALRYSPLLVSVDAWRQDSNGLYIKDKGAPDNHATTLYGYKDQEYWCVFDSYDATFKKLAWDYNFLFIKRFVLEKKSEDELQSLVELLCDIFTSLWRKITGVIGF